MTPIVTLSFLVLELLVDEDLSVLTSKEYWQYTSAVQIACQTQMPHLIWRTKDNTKTTFEKKMSVGGWIETLKQCKKR
jgi:hypothetical protein